MFSAKSKCPRKTLLIVSTTVFSCLGFGRSVNSEFTIPVALEYAVSAAAKSPHRFDCLPAPPAFCGQMVHVDGLPGELQPTQPGVRKLRVEITCCHLRRTQDCYQHPLRFDASRSASLLQRLPSTICSGLHGRRFGQRSPNTVKIRVSRTFMSWRAPVQGCWQKHSPVLIRPWRGEQRRAFPR